MIGPLYDDGAGPTGLAVIVDRDLVAATDELRRALGPRRPGLARRLPDPRAIPLCDGSQLRTRQMYPWGYLDALIEVLVDRPALRVRLDFPARAVELATDLRSAGSHHLRNPTGASFELNKAIASLELFPHGRPLPGDELPAPADLVERVRTQLKHNRSVLHSPSDAEIRGALDGQVYAVSPWPFGALTRPLPPPVPDDAAVPDDGVPDDEVVPPDR